MSSFLPTEQRLAVTRRRYPAFPREPAVLVRLVKHIYKQLHDDANTLLKPWGINHPEYDLLMMLYGTEGYALNPSQLAEAAGEKSANITRLGNELCDKGLIERDGSSEDRRKVTLTLTRRAWRWSRASCPKSAPCWSGRARACRRASRLSWKSC